jgi:SWI/SNF-related matrix-associated actin-dependent regulator of chromatin subfamily A3
MGLGKTITCVSLIAATLDSARAFAAEPLPLPPPPPPRHAEPMLNAAHFAGAVWGMPDLNLSSPSAPMSKSSAKAQAKAEREVDRLEAEFARVIRVKTKSRATLIICPLSTISNWEDQFREHWKGQVTVVGGGGVSCAAALSGTSAAAAGGSGHTSGSPAPTSGLLTMGPLTQSLLATEGSSSRADVVTTTQLSTAPTPTPTSTATTTAADGPRPCRVYIYHGNARRPDPAFLADFDAVITTYSTLATEYSKQSKSLTPAETDEDESSPGENMIEVDENGNQVVKIPAAKKGTKRKKMCTPSAAELSSPLQSVAWFRVVLDEAQ